MIGGRLTSEWEVGESKWEDESHLTSDCLRPEGGEHERYHQVGLQEPNGGWAPPGGRT